MRTGRRVLRQRMNWSADRAPGYSAAMSDYELSTKSNLPFLAMGREAQAKAPELIAATWRSQASSFARCLVRSQS
jgi:hypothetical protein